MKYAEKLKLLKLVSTSIESSIEAHDLRGLSSVASIESLSRQVLDSISRVQYVYTIANKAYSASVADPNQSCFDPIKAAIYHRNLGNLDEACWLIFLSIHFGKNRLSGWKLARHFYAGPGTTCAWFNIMSHQQTLEPWLHTLSRIKSQKKSGLNFGNHRKYESINPAKKDSTLKILLSYIDWVTDYGDHASMLSGPGAATRISDHENFERIYSDMNILRFGRTAKFDYLSMIGKLGLANLEPGKAYLLNSTGPLAGARLLFDGHRNSRTQINVLESKIANLATHLSLGKMQMQVLEDALCNWQKSPQEFRRFSG